MHASSETAQLQEAARHANSETLFFKKLPFDVICEIFQLVCDVEDPTDDYVRNLRNIQLICSAFRDIILELPAVWSVVDSRMELQRISLQLQRSGNVPLVLRLATKVALELQEHYCALYALIKQHSARIYDAMVFINFYELIAAELGYDGLNLLSGWDMPLLKTLAVNVSIIGQNMKVADLRWNTPKLESLLFLGSQQSIELPIDARLKVLYFKPTRGRTYDAGNLIRHIQSAASTLESLFFIFSDSAGVFINHQGDGQQPSQQWSLARIQDQVQDPVVLPCLKKLRIVLTHLLCNVDILKLLQVFDLSNVPSTKIIVYSRFVPHLSSEDRQVFSSLLLQGPSNRELDADSLSSIATDIDFGACISQGILPIDQHVRQTFPKGHKPVITI